MLRKLALGVGVLVLAGCGTHGAAAGGNPPVPRTTGEQVTVTVAGHPLHCLWVPSRPQAGFTCDWVAYHAEIGDIDSSGVNWVKR